MLQEILLKLFNRDLNKLKNEIALYPDDASLWIIDGQIANSAGNLCLHLVGNLNTFIGAQLGHTGYVRNREAEFALKDIPGAELISKIEATIEMVDSVIANLTDEQLVAEYPIVVLETSATTAFFLSHLSTHLSYHLGQVNYHRRLLTK